MLLSLIVFSFIYIAGILGESCDSNSNCTENAICEKGKCQCDTISFLKDGKCLSYVTEYRGFCTESHQCDWLGENADCLQNECVCQENYTWYQGKCQRYAGLDEYCDESVICHDGINPLAMQCDLDINKCVCGDEYYNRGHDCRKSLDDDSCAINYDCQQMSHSSQVCSRYKCTINPNPHQTYNHHLETSVFEEKPDKTLIKTSDTDNCTSDDDCKNMVRSVCDAETRTCKCKNNNFEHDGNCLPGYGVCDKNETCSSFLSNSYCFHGICVCKQGYFYSNNTCIPEIGMVLETNDTDCKIKASEYQDGACFCIKLWSVDEYNRQCIKSIAQDNLRCVNSYWCNAMGPYSFCNSSQMCQCSSFAELDEETFYCKPLNFTSDFCVRDTACGYNRKCQNEKCVCKENFTEIDGKCLPDLGGSCGIQGCSHIENSLCLDNKCTCGAEFINYENNQCLPMVKHWEDKCEVSEQCEEFKFTECSKKKKKCKCIGGYEKVNDKCWQSKDYGSSCMTSEDCTTVLNKYFQCRNNKCLCPIGQALDNGFCVNNFSVSLVSSWYLLIVLLFSAFLI